MLERRVRRIAMVLLVGVTTTGVAVAATTGSSDEVSGTIELTLTGPPVFKPCGNQAIGRVTGTLTGTATSSDSRLAGDVTMRLRRVTDQNGPGADASPVFIHDPDTGRLNANGTFVAVSAGSTRSGVLNLQLHRPSGHAVVVIGFTQVPADTPAGFKVHGEYGAGKTAPANGVVAEGC